ncbi:MAG: hypothetical protein ACRDLF_02590 [Solirubrobacteraceae bacterium]
MPVSPEGASIRDAIYLLIDSADHADGSEQMTGALGRALAETQQELGDSLEGRHLPDVEERHAELDAYICDAAAAPPLSHATWLLVLSHLSPDEQQRLQREYEQLARGATAAADYGEQRAEAAEGLMHALTPAEELLAELPHTTLDRSEGVDDYEQRRRSLTIEVTDQPDSDDASYTEPLRVVWRDGYHSLVATMTAGCYEQQLHWKLDIEDPSPGREASLFAPLASTDAREAARDNLGAALAWAATELGDTYTIAPWPPTGDHAVTPVRSPI